MANTPKVDPIAALRGKLAAHARDPRAKLAGLDGTLLALDAAVDEFDRRVGTLAESYLLLLEAVASNQPIKLHVAVLDTLGAMNDHASIIARRLKAPAAMAPHYPPM